jgi:glutathione synthase
MKNRKIKLAVVMDPIADIHYQKDTTLAMLLEAAKRGWELFYLEQKDLYIRDGQAWGKSISLTVYENKERWFQLFEEALKPLSYFDLILMRKDPPFDMEYIYTTYILEFAKQSGVLVVNDPQGLRDANEKVFAQWFANCMPPTIITKDPLLLRDFIKEYKDIVLKPLHSMGGGSIFRLKEHDVNISVTIEILTGNGLYHIMAQRFIPEIEAGDKRIFILDGKPLPYALARLPAKGEIRGNLAAGGKAKGVKLTVQDYAICEQVGDTLKQKGLLFVGLDVIGHYLTEINVTSPTCVRELHSFFEIDVCREFFDCLENYLT